MAKRTKKNKTNKSSRKITITSILNASLFTGGIIGLIGMVMLVFNGLKWLFATDLWGGFFILGALIVLISLVLSRIFEPEE